jgi:hypothetical protein
MKKTGLFPSLLFIIALSSCGPAAENRQMMHERAKVFQDSIANFIRTTMAEAEAPGPKVISAPGAPSTVIPQPTGTPQPTQSVNPNAGVNKNK